jgi:hypothetical protein
MNDQFSISLNLEQINAMLRQLDAGPHNVVRPLIDSVIGQVQAQQQARQQAAAPIPEAGADE